MRFKLRNIKHGFDINFFHIDQDGKYYMFENNPQEQYCIELNKDDCRLTIIEE